MPAAAPLEAALHVQVEQQRAAVHSELEACHKKLAAVRTQLSDSASKQKMLSRLVRVRSSDENKSQSGGELILPSLKEDMARYLPQEEMSRAEALSRLKEIPTLAPFLVCSLFSCTLV